jgi:enterochelin esterase-like enzyme
MVHRAICCDTLPTFVLLCYVKTRQIEWLLASNRRIATVLLVKGYPHCYEEFPRGQNRATWEEGLELGRTYLFGEEVKSLLFYSKPTSSTAKVM